MESGNSDTGSVDSDRSSFDYDRPLLAVYPGFDDTIDVRVLLLPPSNDGHDAKKYNDVVNFST